MHWPQNVSCSCLLRDFAYPILCVQCAALEHCPQWSRPCCAIAHTSELLTQTRHFQLARSAPLRVSRLPTYALAPAWRQFGRRPESVAVDLACVTFSSCSIAYLCSHLRRRDESAAATHPSLPRPQGMRPHLPRHSRAGRCSLTRRVGASCDVLSGDIMVPPEASTSPMDASTATDRSDAAWDRPRVPGLHGREDWARGVCGRGWKEPHCHPPGRHVLSMPGRWS